MLRKDALSEFAADDEKSAPPVFIGREKILSDLQKCAELGWKKDRKGSPGSTRIIQGAPGAGKSSIVAELKKRCNKTDHEVRDWEIGEPRVLELDPIDIIDLDLALSELARLVSPKDAKKLVVRTTDTSGLEAGADLKIAGAKKHQSQTSERATSAAMTTFKNWLRDHNIILRGPIIIVIDEAQTLPAVDATSGSQFLLSIHKNTHQLPISVVLAGLSDTQARAGDMGLNRSLRVHSIGRFTPEESTELMQKWCTHFDLHMGSQQQRLQAYCQLADDWPRHLHCAQKALAQVIVDRSNSSSDFTGELDALTEPEWSRVTMQFAQYRLEYYRDRMSSEMKTYKPLITSVMRSLHNESSRTDVLDVLAGDSKNKDFPNYTKETTDFFNHLIHQGALQEEGDGIVSCPIPSFRTWLIESGPLKSKIFTLRYGVDIYQQGEFDCLSDARDWAVKQLYHLKTDRTISLWQGAIAVDILRDCHHVEPEDDLAEETSIKQAVPHD